MKIFLKDGESVSIFIEGRKAGLEVYCNEGKLTAEATTGNSLKAVDKITAKK